MTTDNTSDVQPGCPFCLTNNIFKGLVTAESENAFLTADKVYEDLFLIIPKKHIESLVELPDGWWRDVKDLLPQVPGLTESFNVSINIGKTAGQSLKHLHFWVIPRQTDMPSSGKGLALLIKEADKRGV